MPGSTTTSRREASACTSEPLAASLEQFGYRQELRRALTLFDLLVYGLAIIGPFSPVSVFGIVFNMSHGLVPLVYVFGFLAMIFTALSYMAMSRAFPLAGSVYAYAARTFGPTVGFFAGWRSCSIICCCRPSSTSPAPSPCIPCCRASRASRG